MCFVKEKDHLGFIQIACFRHHFVELGKHPQQEGGVEQRALEQFGSVQQIDNTAAVFCRSKPVLDIQCRFAEENIRTLILQTQQSSLDSTDAGGSDVAVACFELGSIITDVLYHAAQILEIQQQQALVICYAENNIHYTALSFVQLQQTAEQIRSHFRNGCAHGNASLAVNVPEAYRVTGKFPVCFQTQLISQTLAEVFAVLTGQAHTGNVALDISQKNRYAHFAEAFCQHLERNGFACTGSTGNQAVTICHFGIHIDTALVILTKPDFMQFRDIHLAFLLAVL